MKLHRHDLVWLKSQSAYSEALKAWIETYPCVVARSEDLSSECFRAAICLSSEKSSGSRLSFIAGIDDILKHSSAVTLHSVITSCHIDSLQVFCDTLNRLGYNPCVYGSFAWQMITDKPYISETSDLDLLLHINRMEQLEGLVDLLFQSQTALKRTIDGELIFAEDYAVAWREWYSANDKILVKTINSISIMDKRELLEKTIRR